MFSLKRDSFRGEPTVEVLIDGQAWGQTHTWDAHFRFGLFKARMIMTYLDVIEEFGASHGRSPSCHRAIKRRMADSGLECTCTTLPSFVNSYGCHVEEPYVKLQSRRELGLGVEKANALVVLAEDVERFALQLRRKGIRRPSG